MKRLLLNTMVFGSTLVRVDPVDHAEKATGYTSSAVSDVQTIVDIVNNNKSQEPVVIENNHAYLVSDGSEYLTSDGLVYICSTNL